MAVLAGVVFPSLCWRLTMSPVPRRLRPSVRAPRRAPPYPPPSRFHPDTLNLKDRGRWVTAYVELPQGYDVDDIDLLHRPALPGTGQRLPRGCLHPC